MRDDQYILNLCAPYIPRTVSEERHNFGHYAPGDPRGRIREAWRFPVIDTCAEPPAGFPRSEYNDVTFIFRSADPVAGEVAVVGTFGNLYEPLALRRVQFLGQDSSYHAVTVPVPRRGVFRYQFIVDGQAGPDPLNVQQVIMDNGVGWSGFFTWECGVPVAFEPWELAMVQRFCNHILPFRTREGQRFLSWYYEGLDRQARQGLQRRAYRMDDSVGAATYIDHILAREESHHRIDYQKCLRQVRRILRQRDPAHEPADVSKDLYVEIYHEMAANAVNGWDREDYRDPRYFLDLLRRHAFTGAFAHPKYGGNAGAAGWTYLNTELTSPGNPIFDWARSQEAPLGTSASYLG